MDADSVLSQLIECMRLKLGWIDADLVRDALTAALSLSLTERCETCEGCGGRHDGGYGFDACLRCEGSGRVPSSVRLLIGEQVEGAWYSPSDKAPYDDAEPVYRVITKGDAV